MLNSIVETKVKRQPETHVKVEKYFLLFGNPNRKVIHNVLFEIIGKNQGVQC
ncbi:hypothetical protein [Puniceibacterium sediminis]|uniref:Uncharacterized protein n=1 Tax=Puniceibacterium sediminis TaxID=1608407 RepID=A0A238WE37_9RHOB|nr:hypothetical protein SAMN06265370_105132 [Puniceibacterium sediminis]